ncbi:MAG: DUF4377 domain-containing protein [Muribaculum sp.]|nr:DUF4377 domain-containing protein [Muribaculum sp.]
MNKLIIPLILIFSTFGIVLTSCSDDEPKDNVKEISMTVSSETGVMYDLFDSNMEHPIECMLVMSEESPGTWSQLSFEAIKGFSYERGHEYELRVKQTIMANPPMDGSDRYYELVRIVSDRLVVESEVSADDAVNSEADIEYQEGCPINKYSISESYIVDDNGEITYGDGSTMPSYDNARLWLTNILDVADPNWVKYQKVPYQATYSYVISPLNDKIRLVRNQSNGPMFKDVVPEDEYKHIAQNMMTGDELKYTLILANVYKKGIQKLEFVMTKTGDVPDKYKFKFVEAGMTTLMGDNYPFAAPFDNITYRITDNYERYEPVGFPEFTQYYDSIVWCADNLPNTVRIYEQDNTENSIKQHIEHQWSTHFFNKGEQKTALKGYRKGEVIYSTSLTTTLRERDFLCYDWTNGSVAIGNPGNTAIYCPLDSQYEYQAFHTQEQNGVRFAQIRVWNKKSLSEAEFLPVSRDALIELMTDNIGQAQSPSGKVETFKCLPSESVEAINFWENKTTRILLLLSTPDEYGFQDYYLHFESK